MDIQAKLAAGKGPGYERWAKVLDVYKRQEQKKAARSGYDMDILPPDLVTYGNDAKTLLEDLQSRNERMFLLTLSLIHI